MAAWRSHGALETNMRMAIASCPVHAAGDELALAVSTRFKRRRNGLQSLAGPAVAVAEF